MAGSVLSCAIIHNRTRGLTADAFVLASAIGSSDSRAGIAIVTLPGHYVDDYESPIDVGEAARAPLPFDYVFLLGHARANPPLLDRAFARHVVYVPNVEWIQPRDLQVIASGSIDTVFLKTRHSGAIFSGLAGAGRVKNGQLFTGWTSPDLGRHADERSWDQFLHISNAAPQRNTDAVISAWLRNPEFPIMTVVAAVSTGFDLSIPLRASDNLRLILNKLSEDKLRALQRAAGVHVSPSIVEGFGHTLNEARAAAAVLITTQGPPMDELVEDGSSGILVPVRAENREPFNFVMGYRVTDADLELAVRRVLAMSTEQRRQMGLRARRRYEEERLRFHANIRSFLGA
jgi:glycosyltransferase involved in cell wall biosynthesis